MSMIGKTLGHYSVSTLIGRGGMGEVYKAKDQKLGRDVAIKVLPEEFAKDADRVARFQREAKLLASLNHPNIAGIHQVEQADGQQILVMELVEGEDLSTRIARGAIPVPEALPMALQIAEALEAAHEKGVVHRDLKPANVKLTEEGQIKVLDFGLAKALAPDPISGEGLNKDLSMSPTLTAHATAAGVIWLVQSRAGLSQVMAVLLMQGPVLALLGYVEAAVSGYRKDREKLHGQPGQSVEREW